MLTDESECSKGGCKRTCQLVSLFVMKNSTSRFSCFLEKKKHQKYQLKLNRFVYWFKMNDQISELKLYFTIYYRLKS